LHRAFGNQPQKPLASCRSKIINTLKSNLVILGKHKFASNVMEKCLEYGTEDECRMLVGLILKDSNEKSSGDDSALQTLTRDQYGNYVIQKALEVIVTLLHCSALISVALI